MGKRILPPTDFRRHVLQSPARTREQFAWNLLYAVKDLFPDRYAELEEIARRFKATWGGELPVNVFGDVQDAEYRLAVTDWATRAGFACEAVVDAAERDALGLGPEEVVYVLDQVLDQDDDDPDDPTPRIRAHPHDETREEFLKRAGQYYDALVQLFQAGGGTANIFGALKRDSEHIRALAAHLVGRFTWAEIATGKTKLPVRIGDERAIAAGARQVAATLQIQLKNQRGPRKGSHRHPRPAKR